MSVPDSEQIPPRWEAAAAAPTADSFNGGRTAQLPKLKFGRLVYVCSPAFQRRLLLQTEEINQRDFF